MKDILHWSFGDNVMLKETIFQMGFSAPQSTLPDGPFDPKQNWENRYDVIYSGLQGFKDIGKIVYGSLHLKLNYQADSARLEVASVRQTGQNFVHERAFTKTAYSCQRDALFSLKPDSHWMVQTELKNIKKPEAAPYNQYQFKGAYNKNLIHKKGTQGQPYVYRRTSPDVPVVPNWSVLAAVQNLPRDQAYTFDYFEDLERLLPGHSIKSIGDFEARFGGRPVRLHGYAQKGYGLLPTFYWVNEAGRLLIARYGMYLLIYNSNPIIDSHPAKAWKGAVV
ncbi:MAG: hypothetical protein ACPGF8_07450 [Opitutales bacterium]